MELGLLRLPSAGLPLGADFSMDLDLIVPEWLPELPKELASLGAPAAPAPGKDVRESASPKGPLHVRQSSGSASDSGSEEAGPGEDDGEECEDGPSVRSKSTSLTSQDSEAAARVRRSARLHGTAAACHSPKVRCLMHRACNGLWVLRLSRVLLGSLPLSALAQLRPAAASLTPHMVGAAKGEAQGWPADCVGGRPQLAGPDAAGAAHLREHPVSSWRAQLLPS